MTPTTFVSWLLCPQCHEFTECDANSASIICDICGYDIAAEKRWKETPQTADGLRTNRRLQRTIMRRR